jgi:catechol 2,3-dioxygenase-like lactoylglutathione lyase family enzyme
MFTRGLSEIVLIVRDVPAAARFYREVVGLIPESESDDDWAWFWAGTPGVAQRVALHRGTLLFEDHSPRPAGERFGQVHYAFHVPRDQLMAAVAHMQAAGIDVYGPVHFEQMAADSYYFYDPDGNLLEFWSPV